MTRAELDALRTDLAMLHDALGATSERGRAVAKAIEALSAMPNRLPGGDAVTPPLHSLLPCPFCGTAPEIGARGCFGDGDVVTIIRCPRGHAQVEAADGYGPLHHDPERPHLDLPPLVRTRSGFEIARERWNTRCPEVTR